MYIFGNRKWNFYLIFLKSYLNNFENEFINEFFV